MRYRIPAIVALFPLIGAAPLDPSVSAAAVECRASLKEAQRNFAALPVTRTNGGKVESDIGLTQDYDPAGVTVLGQPARAVFVNEAWHGEKRRHVYSVELPGPFTALRAAMLELHGKASCNSDEVTTPGQQHCQIPIRTEGKDGGIAVDMIVIEHRETIAAACFYTYSVR